MRERIKRILLELKEILTTKTGWLLWLIVNLFWSSFWLVPLVYGFIFEDSYMYALAGTIYLFFAQPLIPMWLVTALNIIWLYRIVKKKKTDSV
jgi:hypothetical protein